MLTLSEIIEAIEATETLALCERCGEFTSEPVEEVTFDAHDQCTFHVFCPECEA